MAIVAGIAKWAHVHKPNTNFEPVYSIDLIIDEETAKKLESDGHKVDQKDDGFIFKIKRKVTQKDGQLRPVPMVVDSKLHPITIPIGNGSKVEVQYRAFDWEYAGKKGIGADLIAVKVIELQEFGQDSIEFEEAEGFEVEAVEDVEFDTNNPFEDE